MQQIMPLNEKIIVKSGIIVFIYFTFHARRVCVGRTSLAEPWFNWNLSPRQRLEW